MTKKILIVDDDEDFLISIKMILDYFKYNTKTAPNGGKALELLKKEKFDLVLLDNFMPGMSGKEILEKIRGDPKLKGQKVAILTASRITDADKAAISALSPIAHLEKPIDKDNFIKTLKKILK